MGINWIQISCELKWHYNSLVITSNVQRNISPLRRKVIAQPAVMVLMRVAFGEQFSGFRCLIEKGQMSEGKGGGSKERERTKIKDRLKEGRGPGGHNGLFLVLKCGDIMEAEKIPSASLHRTEMRWN